MGSWTMAPMLTLNNRVVRGSTSFRDWLAADVPAGTDQRFYPRTIRGVFPGIFLNLDDGAHFQRIYVKSLGFDKEKRMPYMIADTPQPFTASGLFSNKNHTNLMLMNVRSHTEEQTFDVMLERHKYSQGDTYLYSGRFFYMGDVHSTAGDENGVIYAGFVLSETGIYRGKVVSFNPATNELNFSGEGPTLGTGRPMINLNPAKWITQGTVLIVRPGNWTSWDDPTTPDPVFEGKTWPTTLVKGVGLRFGGLMRFSADAPLTNDIIGRYFAVDAAGEYVPGGEKLRRWYYIDGLTVNPDGTKDITVIRHWWGAKTSQSVMLYKDRNYSHDGHLVPLTYVIAPGANVYDVSDAVGPTAGRKIVKVAPGPDTGTAMDFAKDDAIEQAIGPDPFRPTPFRSWCFERVPGAFPSTIFDVRNDPSSVTRTAVLTVQGPSSADTIAQRFDEKPSFENILLVHPVTTNVITFNGDVTNAALYFKQPNQRAQPIKWLYGDGKKAATLTVSPADGTMTYQGGAVAAPGGVVQTSGVSGTATAARNLRGVAVAVPAGATELAVTFPQAEADNTYAVFLEPSWLTVHAATKRTPEGFTALFATPAPAAAELSWLLVR